MRLRHAGLSLLCLSLLIVAGCAAQQGTLENSSSSSSSLSSAVASGSGALGGSGTDTTDAGQSSSYAITNAANITPRISEANVALAKAANAKDVLNFLGVTLSAKEKTFLDANKFLLLPEQRIKRGDSGFSMLDATNYDQMLTDFDKIGGQSDPPDRKPENVKLFNPDIMLHAYHRLFENSLEELEKKDLGTLLRSFVTSLRQNAVQAAQKSGGDASARAWQVAAQMTVSAVLMENQAPPKPDYFDTPEKEQAWDTQDQKGDTAANALAIFAKEYKKDFPADLQKKIADELTHIYEAKDVVPSPLYVQYKKDLKTDYTQYTPRSHYTKSSALRAYFRTMMYLGRNSYMLKSPLGAEDSALLAQLFVMPDAKGNKPVDAWQKIMNVTSFYAGQSDDISYPQWHDFLASTAPEALASPASAVDQANVQKISANLSALQPPKILSDVIVNPDVTDKTKQDLLNDTKAFRIFGQRFTFDAWILNDLTAGDEQTDAKLPSTPTALFINAALGDDHVRGYIGQFLKKDDRPDKYTDADVAGFMTKLDAKKADIAKVTPAEWDASMGSAWLRVLSSLTHPFGKGYPLYMQAASFLDKQAESFLGSYTELKHDTLLYAKQSYAELGGGPAEGKAPPVPKGFVEPNLDFWDKFRHLLAVTKTLYANNGVFANSEVGSRLDEFRDIVDFCDSVAQKELKGEPLTEDEYERLRTTNLSFMAQPLEGGQEPTEDSAKVALIADIHTDGKKGQILYEANAAPSVMLALVGNEQSPRLVMGLAYNQYEFTGPLATRLTDEDWKKTVYQTPDKLPPKNFWYDSLKP